MKNIIVTGSSGNLGRAVVKKFVAEGYRVSGTVLPGDLLPSEIQDDKFEKTVVDLLDENSGEKFVAEIVSKHGEVTAAVLTVGGFAQGNIAATTTADVLKQYKLNFETAYNIARPVFMQMLKQNNGRIFLIGSKPGLTAEAGNGMVAYGLAKSLLLRLAELMNLEAKGKNVVTSVVIPGTIDTPQNRIGMPGADFDNWVRPEDIASVIHYYCTEEAKALREPVIKVYGNA
ncbi:MAG: SDR family NAD(P)-dependent oxidoreductase [Chitinophagaceae bacterium]